MWNKIVNIFKSEEGASVIEVAIILLIVVALAFVFKDELDTILAEIIATVNEKILSIKG